ncbi:MAG TPA: 3'-5' exonuclease [Bacteriovoracaceae bacterium]|nr:3'-5' exonuclease [Bacteriovoracaceae bacterium]
MSENYQKFISKEEINDLPMLNFTGKMVVIETIEDALPAIEKLSTEKYLGFDTETKPSFTKGEVYQVAMLQLATDNEAYLFRLNKMPFCKELAALVSNPNIIKAGVGIQDDLKGLQKVLPSTPEGFVDLSKEATKRDFTSLGLRALTAIFLGVRLSKAAKITNWERGILTPAQLEYAALDAMVGLQIYKKMFEL